MYQKNPKSVEEIIKITAERNETEMKKNNSKDQ